MVRIRQDTHDKTQGKKFISNEIKQESGIQKIEKCNGRKNRPKEKILHF